VCSVKKCDHPKETRNSPGQLSVASHQPSTDMNVCVFEQEECPEGQGNPFTVEPAESTTASGTDRLRAVCAASSPLAESPGFPLYRIYGGPQPVWRLNSKQKSLVFAGNRTPDVQPAALVTPSEFSPPPYRPGAREYCANYGSSAQRT
jgi:hypothetical protein